jgi:hypothetical protein
LVENEELLIPEHGEDKALLQQFMAMGGAPAFIVRANQVEQTWEAVQAKCRQQREEWLAMVRVRLGMLAALAGEWSSLRPWLDDEQVETLRQLHDQLQPKLRVVVAPAGSAHALRRALVVLAETLRRFNGRWQKFLGDVDLTAANQARDKYNRFYLLEKECVVGSASLARRGFTRLAPLTVDDVEAEFPLLPTPDVVKE